MDADYDIFEIVAVIRDFWLVDAESYQRSYCTKDGQSLTPGYYVVFWPEHIRARRFNEHAVFHGPFKLREEAQTAQRWMHKQWQRLWVMSSGGLSIAVPVSRQMEVRKPASQCWPSATGANARQTVSDSYIKSHVP